MIRDKTGLVVCHWFADEMDQVLRGLFQQAITTPEQGKIFKERMAILALGGYGRRELCLYSDVDLLFVFRGSPSPEEEQFVKSLIYPLWDLGIDLGHATRDLKGSLEVVGQDLNSATALIDNRWLGGNEDLRMELTEAMHKRLHAKSNAEWYVEAKLDEFVRRHEKHGNSIYVLEPNVKDGCGGLRDLHSILWLAFVVYGSPTLAILEKKGLMSPHETRALQKAQGFLLDVRNALHSIEKRKTDHLTFERQIKAAPLLGYRAEDASLAEEKLMRAYYEAARVVERLSGRLALTLQRQAEGLLKRAGEQILKRHVTGPFWRKGGDLYIEEANKHLLREDPDLILKAFSLAAGLGLRVREEVLDWISAAVVKADGAFRSSPVNRDLFLGILRNPANCFQTLHDMHECGALGALIPEFERVRHLLRLDFYHQYTVDEHLLLSVGMAEALLTGEIKGAKGTGGVGARLEKKPQPQGAERGGILSHPSRVAQKIKRWDLLNFALLMHDAGKGEGRGHVIRGAQLIEKASERLGLCKRDGEILYRLVISHQRMSHLALRRNVDDPKVAQELARELGDRELLRMLYVMTVCDLQAVAPSVMNDWKAKLLMELYERTKEELYKTRSGPELPAAPPSASTQPALEALAASGAPITDEDRRALERFLAGMPERYRLSTQPAEAALHYIMTRGLKNEEPLQWRLEALPMQNYSQLTVVAHDFPGVFSHICGALASRGANILAAQIYTTAGGLCLDIFQVQDQRGQPIEGDTWLERLRQKLNKIILGKQNAQWDAEADAWRARKIKALTTPERLASRPATIDFNNTASAHHTLLEVKTHDRPGLLYAITRVMAEQRVNIDLALIATEGFRVVDVFYVTDWDNNKLEDGPRQQELRKALLPVLEPAAGAAPPPVPSRAPAPGAKK